MAFQRENKIQEFRADALRVAAAELPAVKAAFAPSGFVDPETQVELDRMINALPGVTARADENDILLSHGSRNDMDRGQDAAKRHVDRAALEREARRKSSDMVNFLYMLGYDNIGDYIGDVVFGDMSDDEIAACVDEIEIATGKPIEEYASDILGEDMPERRAGESDVDYHRRVLDALAEEMFELGPDGKPRVKNEYKDDPTAQIIMRDKRYREVVATAESIDARAQVDGATAKLKHETQVATEPDYTVSHIIGNTIVNEELSEVARNGQDGHREDGFAVADRADNSASFLSDLGLSRSFSPAASGEVIEVASPEPTEEAPSPAVGVDPSLI